AAAPAVSRAGVRKPRKPRAPAQVLRPPQRPLKKVARTVTSLTQLNQRAIPNEPVTVDQLRDEFIKAGASSYKLVVTRKDLKELRHHVMRLQSKDHVNILSDQQFTPPVRLHRRDRRAPPGGKDPEGEVKEEDVEEAKERERQEEEKEARRIKREGIQAQIAPTGTTKPKPFGKKTEQKYRPDDTPAAKKRQLLRYEETMPWFLEDDDNKQIWEGTFESEMSERHVMLTTAPSGTEQIIQLAPLERWYRFNPQTKAKSTEDDKLKKMKKDSFFEMREKKKFKEEMEHEQISRARQLRTRVGGGDDDEGRIKRLDDEDMPTVKREADADDIDFNVEEDFADDEEGLVDLFDADDETVKETKEKLKRDQLGAAAFDLRDEREIWRLEELEKKQEEEKALAAEIRKALVKREKNYDYAGSDDEFDSETDSETERQRAKEEEEKKAAEQNGKAVEGDKTASGASSKAASTPSGASRPTDVNKKKRPAPGSPNLSEASGNESARKKHKRKHEKNADGTRKVGPLRTGAASGSDSEMTDAGKAKNKLKVRLGGTPGVTPSASRAGSPAAQVNGSRAGSPAAASGAASTGSQGRPPNLPSAQEIYDALPPRGIEIKALITKFRARMDKSNMKSFINLVKAVASYDKERSWLTPLPSLPSQE
ncbi:Rap30/74 interaction domain-containing protein, partial [Bimuria novae-zelandiae CBS 107.79]